MIPTLVYINVPHDESHDGFAMRFIESYLKFPPGYEHRTVVVFNGSHPEDHMIDIFQTLPNLEFCDHDDYGWDIGAYLYLAKTRNDEALFCCGGPCYFVKPGWLARICESWHKHGPGIHGSLGSYQIRPHLCSTGILYDPFLLRGYGKQVESKLDRYDFEHGPDSMCSLAARMGKPVKLVTWSGEYDWQRWRDPPNIFCRGDQSNCLTRSRVTEEYELGEYQHRRLLEILSDRLSSNFP